MRPIAVLLLTLLLSVAASARDPYSRMTTYAGTLHSHSGTLGRLASQASLAGAAPPTCLTGGGNGDPRDAPVGYGCSCNTYAHAFGHPRLVYTRAFDGGLDYVGISHHTNDVDQSSTTVTTFLSGISPTYSELGSDDVWTFCDPPTNGLRMADASCTRGTGGVGELAWLAEQAVLAMQDRPGHLAMVGGEYTVGSSPPTDGPTGGGHKVFMMDAADPIGTICRDSALYTTVPTNLCKDQVTLFRLVRENRLLIQLAHPCSTDGFTYFGPINYATGGGFDPRAIFSLEVGCYSQNGCLLSPESGKNAGGTYFAALDAGYHLAPAAADDIHHIPANTSHASCGNALDGLITGARDRTVIWASDLSFASLRAAYRARLVYWARAGKPEARMYGYDEAGTTSNPDARMGGFVQSADSDFRLEATITDGATFTDLEVWHNNALVLDETDPDVVCSTTTCTLTQHEFTSSIDGWWVLIARGTANVYDVITAPIWVNRQPDDFLGAPAIPFSLVP